ncbi:MAG TPA: HDOD domain-containing protein, partial [Burkholderiales bacterium]|nr:HDOD domain-containing protein [Burkholderiales bacterium]
CEKTRVAQPEECFIGALLSDVGSLALATLYPEGYAGILRQSLSPEERVEKERALFSTDHLELTSALLSDWMLPPLFSTIALHRENPQSMPFSPESREFKLCTLWHFSDMLAEAFLSGEKAMVGQMSMLIREARKIGLEPDEFASICNQAISSWADWGKILDVPGKSLPSFEEMMASLPGKEDDALHPLRIVLAGSGRDLADFLSSTGHAVLVGQDMEEAMQFVIQADPQVVICMPGIDGATFSKALRAISSGKEVYLVVLSRDGRDESVISAFGAGADDFVLWPSSMEVLAAHLLAAQRYNRMKEALSF